MDPNDLRSQYDLETDQVVVYTHLTMTGPPAMSREAVGHDTTGLQCLVMVVRRILALFLDASRDELAEIREMGEAENPLLGFAWQNFLEPEPANGDATALLEESAKSILDTIVEDGSSLIDLMQCRTMNKTLWSRPEFLLYRPVLEEARGWARETEDRFSRHSTEAVLFDIEKGGLQKLMDSKFGIRIAEDGTREIWNSNEPSFIRIACAVSRPVKLSDVRSFTTPVGCIIRDQDGGSSYVKDSFRIRYNLVAVVRTRTEEDEPDLVHTYRTDGGFIGRYEPSPECFNTEWLMADGCLHDFFLIYARSERGPEYGFPEDRQPPQTSQAEQHSAEN